ncbi:hypothetical protein L1887_11229 [Cichorium endivia]|nr:hypothetical protein L1887_11229 [Cichorium endivia]
MGVKNLPPSLLPCNKINLNKVPKRILGKAKREKMKREHLNQLFLILSNALEIREQNCEKIFILGETMRVVKDMLDEINRLKEENAALLSESQYVNLLDNICDMREE